MTRSVDSSITPNKENAIAGSSVAAVPDATKLSELSNHQWKSGIAAWLGWLFDGLDMHLYVLVAAPFVTELLHLSNQKDPIIGYYSSLIQAAFLIGWALGGGLFGRIADKIGRSRALSLTILTYALFTGLSYFAQEWWHLLAFRFLAALGIGGEWAVGASLISETWPKRWRPWTAAVLQTAVNLGVMLAALATFILAGFPSRTVFLVGIFPALLVLWIRWSVPETDEWHDAKKQSIDNEPEFWDLFRGPVCRTTLLTLTVCTLSLTAHWGVHVLVFTTPSQSAGAKRMAGRRQESTSKSCDDVGNGILHCRQFSCCISRPVAEISKRHCLALFSILCVHVRNVLLPSWSQ